MHSTSFTFKATRLTSNSTTPMIKALLLGVLALLGGLLAPQGARGAERYAVLVGIADYPSGYLMNCDKDARDFARMLKTRYNFPEDHLTLLLNREATCKNILEAIKSRLLDGSKPGDTVVFFYSGHGTSVPDQDGDEPDGKDEGICPVDCIGNPDALILDDTMARIVSALADRRLIVVLDSCFSGTALRDLDFSGGTKAKFLPASVITRGGASKAAGSGKGKSRGELEDLITGLSAGGSGALGARAGRAARPAGASGFDGAGFLTPGGKSGDKAILVAGCRDSEVSSAETIFEGQKQANSVLTFHLMRAVSGTGDENGDGEVSGTELTDYFTKTFPASDPNTQHPQVEGDTRNLALPLLTTKDIGAGAAPEAAQASDAGAALTSAGYFGLISPLLMLLSLAVGKDVAAAPAGQDAWLVVKSRAGRAPQAEVREVVAWDFFDARGKWLPERERIQILPAESGGHAYRLRYRAPEGAAGEFAAVGMRLVDAERGTALEKAFQMRPVPADGGSLSKAALSKGTAADQLTARHEALDCFVRAFRKQAGRGGLEVTLKAEHNGGRVRFTMQANRACRAILVDLSSSGRAALLGQPLALAAGEAAALPASGAGFSLSGPAGTERVALLALPSAPAAVGGDAVETANAWLGADCASDAAELEVESGTPAQLAREGDKTAAVAADEPTAEPRENGSARPAPAPRGDSNRVLEGLFK